MSLRKKLLGSAATIAVASMATMGGTFAYFSSTVSASSQFTNGTLVLSPNQPYLQHFSIDNFKPGDKLMALQDNVEPAMVLNNHGTLPMNVFAKIDTSSVKGSTDSIIVKQLKFGGEDLLAKYPGMDADGNLEVTLTELSNFFKGDTTVNGNPINGVGKYIGYLNAQGSSSETIKSLKYEFDFKDTGSTQNNLQGDVTNIDFQFTGLQYNGKTLDKTNLDNFKEDGTPSGGGGGDYKRTDDINDRSGETTP